MVDNIAAGTLTASARARIDALLIAASLVSRTFGIHRALGSAAGVGISEVVGLATA